MTTSEIEMFGEELKDGKIRFIFYKDVEIFVNDKLVYESDKGGFERRRHTLTHQGVGHTHKKDDRKG